MLRKAFVSIVIIAGGLCVVAVQAQQKRTSDRTPSLSERLEELRRGLMGEGISKSQSDRASGNNSSPSPSKRNAWSASRKLRPSSNSRQLSPIPSLPLGLRPPTVELPAARTAQRTPAPSVFESSSRRGSQVVSPTSQSAITPPPREQVSSRRPLPLADSLPPITPTSRPTDDVQMPSAGEMFTRHSPQLAVSTSGPRKITIGKEATFTIRLKNSGQVAANDIVVVLRIPTWCEVVGAKASRGVTPPIRDAAVGETYQWALNRLGTGAVEQLDLRLVPRKSRPFDLGVSWTFAPPATRAMVEVQEPKLLMAVSGPDEMVFGQTKIFKLTLSNPGTGDAENVTINLLPIEAGDGQPTSQRLGPLRAGDSRIVEIELTARQAGSLVIKASAAADGGLRSKVDHTILVRRAELRIDVEVPMKRYAGTIAAYAVHVTNPGNATAEGIKLTARLPQGATFVSSSGGGVLNADLGTVEWKLTSLRPNAQEVFDVKCVLTSPGVNRMQVTGTAGDDLSDSFAATTQVEALADLRLLIKDPQGPVSVGEEMTYEVRVINRGTKAAVGIDVVAFFSSGVEPVGVEGTTEYELAAGQVVFKRISQLGAGREIVFNVKAVAEEAGNHNFRTEVLCKSLGTRLAAEETTRFFGEKESTATGRSSLGGARRTPSQEQPLSRFTERRESPRTLPGAR